MVLLSTAPNLSAIVFGTRQQLCTFPVVIEPAAVQRSQYSWHCLMPWLRVK